MAKLPKISLRAEIPEALKAELAPTKWGKVLSVTPVVMTVIATMLAGLSSSEMTRAQYDRSLAAQRQSKAGDQWNFFQGKRLRAVVLRTSLDTLESTSGIRPLDASVLRQALAGSPEATTWDAPPGQMAITALQTGTPPLGGPKLSLSADVQAALSALEESKPDAEIAELIGKIAGGTLDEALRLAQGQALSLDVALKPVNQTIERWEKHVSGPSADPSLRQAFVAARTAYNAQRYDTEARLNQTIAGLFELQVRTSNLSAERHHRRSSRFFYGMLAAQLGVIVATLALAAQKRNLLWAISACAGGVAVAFTIYVLLYV